jgi:hypothetical protein
MHRTPYSTRRFITQNLRAFAHTDCTRDDTVWVCLRCIPNAKRRFPSGKSSICVAGWDAGGATLMNYCNKSIVGFSKY